MSDFAPFGLAVHNQFQDMAKNEFFTVDLNGEEIWDFYLASFPPGTNPIFRERTEHDCSCCKQFIRNIGGVVNIVNNELVTVWDIDDDKLEYPYDIVALKMRKLIGNRLVNGLFRTKEGQYGAAYTMEAGEPPRKWNHFHGKMQTRHLAASPAEERGRYAESAAMFHRALAEIKRSALDDIIALINDKALYRGEEFLGAVANFRRMQAKFFELSPNERLNWVWSNACDMATSRFRNTVIGTLAVDLSSDMPLDAAVKAFETKVAPANYKRPASLITPSMIKDAETTANLLGLMPALQRRFARLSDIAVTDVLWVDGTKRDVMRLTSPFTSLLATAPVKMKVPTTKDTMSIDEFMHDVLPCVETIEVMVKNTHQNNFVSLTAPVQGDELRLFKWNNPFAWSYSGNVTDRIKEKVKRAGGNTGAALRVSLAWFNKDDLDLHSTGPHGHAFFGNKMGILDVDMNAGYASSREPVENQSWTAPKDGVYKIVVNQYNQRETIDVGFTLEMECNNGALFQWNYGKPVKGQLQVLEFTVKHGFVAEIKALKDMAEGSTSRERWGVMTEQFVRVNTVMHSPNFWGNEAVGNKHVIFALDGCVNDEPTRGFYNEYLNPVLEKHRKVFEVLGSKTLCPPSTDQVSGVGFSSTRGDLVTIRADKRTFNVQF